MAVQVSNGGLAEGRMAQTGVREDGDRLDRARGNGCLGVNSHTPMPLFAYIWMYLPLLTTFKNLAIFILLYNAQ